jgi:uncharacterized protein DUF3631
MQLYLNVYPFPLASRSTRAYMYNVCTNHKYGKLPIMPMPNTRDCNAIRALYDQMSINGKGDAARHQIIKVLARNGLTWEDLEQVLKVTAPAPKMPPPTGNPKLNVLKELRKVIDTYVYVMDPHYTLAASLWVLHCWVYDRWHYTPRLALLSPLPGCGKSVFTRVLAAFTPNSRRINHCTAAALFRELGEPQSPTVLLDEGDNLGLWRNPDLRTVLNTGYESGTTIIRARRRYDIFAPLSIAAIGNLPSPLAQRSIILNMHAQPVDKPRLEEKNPDFIKLQTKLHTEIHKWANTCELNPNPPLPLSSRKADNWRPLLAIADSFGIGKEARRAAVKLSDRADEDPRRVLLTDSRTIRTKFPQEEYISGEKLLDSLLKLEEGYWTEWCGISGALAPHRLSRNELAHMLTPFVGPTKVIWTKGSNRTQARSYQWSDFEHAWKAYCP